jgi:hypothetical protein
MEKNASEGVIDSKNRVFAYKNMLVCDGSMIYANPGVNPALKIVEITERAISPFALRPTPYALRLTIKVAFNLEGGCFLEGYGLQYYLMQA